MPHFVVLNATPVLACVNDLDAALLGRIATGERVAFAELYCRISARLLSVATAILSDRHEAEDVVQDVFVIIWNKASAFDEARGSAFSWAVSITRHRAIDRWRSRARRVPVQEVLMSEHAIGLEENLESFRKTGMMDFDDHRVVRCAVAALPTKMRTVIEMIFFHGLSHAQAAARLDQPLGTVKARVRRALGRLRILLRRAGFEHAERVGEALSWGGVDDNEVCEPPANVAAEVSLSFSAIGVNDLA